MAWAGQSRAKLPGVAGGNPPNPRSAPADSLASQPSIRRWVQGDHPAIPNSAAATTAATSRSGWVAVPLASAHAAQIGACDTQGRLLAENEKRLEKTPESVLSSRWISSSNRLNTIALASMAQSREPELVALRLLQDNHQSGRVSLEYLLIAIGEVRILAFRRREQEQLVTDAFV